VKEVVLNEPMFLTATSKLRSTPPWKVHFAILDGSKASLEEQKLWLQDRTKADIKKKAKESSNCRD
jgi:hypothetical protein